MQTSNDSRGMQFKPKTNSPAQWVDLKTLYLFMRVHSTLQEILDDTENTCHSLQHFITLTITMRHTAVIESFDTALRLPHFSVLINSNRKNYNANFSCNALSFISTSVAFLSFLICTLFQSGFVMKRGVHNARAGVVGNWVVNGEFLSS